MGKSKATVSGDHAAYSSEQKQNMFWYKILSLFSSSILWAVCLSYIFPFIWLLYNSFKTQSQFAQNIFSVPTVPTFSNYHDIFGGTAVYVALFNSTFNTILAIVGIVVFSFMVAYFLSRYTFKGRNFLYVFFVTGLLVPVLGLLIPSYIQFHLFGLLNTRFTLLIPYITFNLPTAIYLYDSYMRTVPRSVEEAAFIDGASINQIMRLVMFPMCLPMTSTIVVLNFLFNWNEFPFALVLNSGEQYHTIPIWLTSFQGEYASNITGRLTAMLIASVPIIVAYVFLREKMMSGITAGAVKG